MLLQEAPAKQQAAQSAQVDVELGDRSYPIYIGAGLLDQPELLQRHVRGRRTLVVTNDTIAPLYLQRSAALVLLPHARSVVCAGPRLACCAWARRSQMPYAVQCSAGCRTSC
jgi:hypothetical protein